MWFIGSLQPQNSITIDITKMSINSPLVSHVIFSSQFCSLNPFFWTLHFSPSAFSPLLSLFHSDLCTFLSSAAPLLICVFPLPLQVVSFKSSSTCPLGADSPFAIFILVFEVILSSFLHFCSLDSETNYPFTTSLAFLKACYSFLCVCAVLQISSFGDHWITLGSDHWLTPPLWIESV